MAGRTPAEAVKAYAAPLQRALSCVTDAVLTVSGYGERPDAGPHAASLARGDAVNLSRSTGPRLALAVTQHYRIVRGRDERGP